MNPVARKGRRSLIVAILAAVALSSPAFAETLNDALILAYQTNPALLSQRARLRALDENYVQARAGLGLQASAGAQYSHSQTQEPLYNPGAVGGGRVANLNIEDAAAQAGLSVSQPIYTGGAVTAQMRAAIAQIQAGRQQLRQAEAQVMQQVIQAYADVRRDAQALKIAQDSIDLLALQLRETEARFQSGDQTRTDQAQAEARLDSAHARLALAQAQLGASRANYLAVIGQSPGDLAPEPTLAGLPATIDEATATADQRNPGLLAAEFGERAAAAQVSLAKAANRPTLALSATLGESGVAGANAAYRSESGVAAGVYGQSLSASVVFTQPLFTSGLNSSRIRQALENDNVQRIAVENARRQTLLSVTQAWLQLQAARASVAAYQAQVGADQLAFDGMRHEADEALRPTIEVLNAEQELDQAQQNLVSARHDEYVAAAGLLAAMGRLEISTLAPGAPTYDARAAFDHASGAGPSLPWDGAVAVVDALGAGR